jgi:hypothetical protein
MISFDLIAKPVSENLTEQEKFIVAYFSNLMYAHSKNFVNITSKKAITELKSFNFDPFNRS